MYFINTLNQKLLGIDLKYLVSNSIYVLGGYAVSVVATLAITYIVANYISEHNTGVFRYVLSWYGILAALAFGGITTTLTIATAKGDQVLVQAIFYKIISTGLAFATSLCVALYYFVQGNSELGINFLILGFALPLLEVSNLYTSYLQGKQKFKDSSKFLIVSKISSLIFFTLFIVFLAVDSSYILSIGSFLFVGLMQASYAYYLHRKIRDSNTELSSNTPRSNFFSTSLHLTLMGLFFALGMQADKILLFSVFGSTALAGYWIATAIPLEISRMLGQILSMYVPKLSQVELIDHVFKKKVIRICTAASFIITLGYICYIITAPLIFSILFPKYLEYIYVSQLYGLIVILVPFTFLWTFFITDYNLKNTYLYHVLDPTLQIVLFGIFIFVFNMGITGLVLAIILKTILMNILGVWLFIVYKPTTQSITKHNSL